VFVLETCVRSKPCACCCPGLFQVRRHFPVSVPVARGPIAALAAQNKALAAIAVVQEVRSRSDIIKDADDLSTLTPFNVRRV
jgi:hypothetical protein